MPEPEQVLVDADACPRGAMAVLRRLRRRYGYRLVTVASFHHDLAGDPQVDEHVVAGDEPDSADLVVANRVRRGDIVVTQDWGLAALAMGRGARVLSPTGFVYDPARMPFLLEERHTKARHRRAGGRTRGPSPRGPKDDALFEAALQELLAGEP